MSGRFSSLQTGRRRARGDEGATLIEFAIILPLLLLVLIGIAEIGLYFRSYLSASYASREGARVGAFVGDVADADCLILESVGAILSGTDLARIDRIEIFKADANGNQGLTNTATLVDGGDPLACEEPAAPGDGWSRTTAWAATSRNTVFGPTSDLDIIGVRVVVDYPWATGFPPFSGTAEINESTITRLEPEAFE